MSTALHYKSNMRDVEFNLFEVFKIQDSALGKGPFSSMDESSVRDILTTFEKVCSTEYSASFVESDRVPLKLDSDGNVTLPEVLKKHVKSLYDGGWHKISMPESTGGFGMTPTAHWAAYEFLVGANPVMALYNLVGIMARVIDVEGTEKQKKLYVENMLERKWGATMVLTEPDAGSDVGAGRAKARHIKDDLYEIEGVKRFITSGDHDAVENIVHLVLARPEGAGPGTKGLSLFIVPKFWVNDDGTLGERNGAYCTNIEKKMGIKGSATCEMTFGDKKPARGYLMGNVHDGIRQMFLVIEQARMAIGFKSMSTLSSAYLNALSYAKDRVQGPDLSQASNKASPRVRIITHPDVRRMLMLQKSHTEGMRALCFFAAHQRDLCELNQGTDPKLAKSYDEMNDLLLPMVKGYCSEKAYELLSVSLQTLGGSGYCQEYPMEQYIRDQKIDSLYEGTTHIQSLDLLFRKILRDGGQILKRLFSQIQDSLKNKEGGAALENERAMLTKALGDMEGIFVAMDAKLKESVYHAGFQGNRILIALSETLLSWLLIRQAHVAQEKMAGASEADRNFYESKVATSKFFCQNVLPNVTLMRKLIEAGNLDLMNLKEEHF